MLLSTLSRSPLCTTIMLQIPATRSALRIKVPQTETAGRFGCPRDSISPTERTSDGRPALTNRSPISCAIPVVRPPSRRSLAGRDQNPARQQQERRRRPDHALTRTRAGRCQDLMARRAAPPNRRTRPERRPTRNRVRVRDTTCHGAAATGPTGSTPDRIRSNRADARGRRQPSSPLVVVKRRGRL